MVVTQTRSMDFIMVPWGVYVILYIILGNHQNEVTFLLTFWSNFTSSAVKTIFQICQSSYQLLQLQFGVISSAAKELTCHYLWLLERLHILSKDRMLDHQYLHNALRIPSRNYF